MKRQVRRFFRIVCLALFPAWAGGAAIAQAQDAPVASGKDANSNAAKDRLPPPTITEQSIDLGGRVIKFKASVGAC
jgi:hypothetical protein